MTTLKFNTLSPYSVGFDRMFDRLVNLEHTQQVNNQGFPPYNIRRDGEKFFIDIALAGICEHDIDIEVKEDQLTVKSAWDEPGDYMNSGGEYLHRGISRKKFTRQFTLTDDIEVQSAEYVNGLLTIHLERIIPEEKRPKKIAINSKKELLVE